MSHTEGGDQQDSLTDLPGKPKSGDLCQGHFTTWVEKRQYACRFLRSQNCGQSTDQESSRAPCGRRNHSPSQWVSPFFLLQCSCSQRNDFLARLHGQAHLEVGCDTVAEFLETNHEGERTCATLGRGLPIAGEDRTTPPSAFRSLTPDVAMTRRNGPCDNYALGKGGMGTWRTWAPDGSRGAAHLGGTGLLP